MLINFAGIFDNQELTEREWTLADLTVLHESNEVQTLGGIIILQDSTKSRALATHV